jgi:RNA polymerase sigma-70 factor, ECF subfamily
MGVTSHGAVFSRPHVGLVMGVPMTKPILTGPTPVSADGGQPREFVVFYQASFRRLVGQIYTVVGNVNDAEDLVQDAFIEASRRWQTIGEYDNPESWVRCAALNRAANLRRRAMRKSRAIARLAGGLTHAPGSDSGSQHGLVEALSRVPLKYRVILSLHYLLDLSVAEIAAELDLPLSTVKTRLTRGRKRLKEHLSTEKDES